MDDVVYRLVAARASGRCECGCGRGVPPGHADHVFGRAKAEETEFTMWILHPSCDFDKTNNRPSGPEWCRRFIRHCERYGYAESKQRAENKLAWLEARKGRVA